MTVATVTTWKSAPGEREALLKVFAAAKLIHERHGGRVRMWAAGLAGASFGNLIYVVEHDDHAAYARYLEKVQADPDWHAMAPVMFKGSPGTVLSNVQLTELTFP